MPKTCHLVGNKLCFQFSRDNNIEVIMATIGTHLSNYYAVEVGTDEDQCYVCFEKMTNTVIPSCMHKVDRHCLSQWLLKDSSCPTCRNPVIVENVRAISA